MQFHKIKSYAKVNISLRVLNKLKSKLHKIESLVSFIRIHDEIFIKKITSKNHKIIFNGEFSNKIPKNNTILILLKILDIKKKLKGQKYLIKIKKNIPQKSGMGGGSMNAASILKYLIKDQKIKLSAKEILEITSKIGSDVILGVQNKSSINTDTGIFKISKKNKLFTLLIWPNFGCSTKEIYKGVKFFSRPVLKKSKNIVLNNKIILTFKNDLEKAAFKKYPILKSIKKFMEKLDHVLFVNMTGSGSTIVGYFNSKKNALNAQKILKKKYKKYWCILSKTI